MNSDSSSLFPIALPANARPFFSPAKTNEWLQQGALNALKDKLNKIETNDFKLHVADLELVNKKFTLADQKQAVLDKKDLTIPVKGTVNLLDKKTGKIVDSKNLTLTHLPYITDRNTILLNGSEYIVTNQQRLKPGVYIRIKESGEVEAHVNVQSGTGMGGKILFHASKALFVYEVGTTQIKLYGLLKDLGISDAEMEKAWGKEILAKNKEAYTGDEIEKFYSKVFKYQ